MIEHAISSFEEMGRIIAQVHNGVCVTIYVTNKITPLSIIRMDGKTDKIILHKNREGDKEYCVLQIGKGAKQTTTSFYLSGPSYRAYTNYWHAYAHMLQDAPSDD